MLLKTWRFITIILTSLLMTMGFTHLWQIPLRMTYDGSLWFRTVSMYEQFGPEGPGPFVEVGAIISAVVLLFLVRERLPAAVLSLASAVSLIAAFAAWWMFIYPVSVEMLKWSADSLPANWSQFRDQWEYALAARAVLQLLGLSGLVISLLIEIPMPRASERVAHSTGERHRDGVTFAVPSLDP